MKAPESPKNHIYNAIALCIYLLLFTLPQSSNSQQLAFPSAYGAGAYATGGRNGSVSIVTNLNDSGVGSLRSFANVSNTTIVFNVSGVINLSSSLWLYGKNVTIAGQTAPEGGITIDGARVIFQDTDNLICRYIRFRGGYHENNDTAGGYYLNNVIFDHCSFSFGGDEALSIIVDSPNETGGEITVQNCLIAESSTGSIMGGEEAPDNVFGVSMIGNVYYNISHRFPNLNSNSRYDVINNYVHNHSKRMIRGNLAYRLNELGNLYDYGDNRVWDEVLNHHGCNEGVDIPTIFAQGNTIIGSESQVAGETVSNTIPEMNANNRLMWKYFYDSNSYCGFGLKNRGDQLESDFFTSTQFPIMGRVPTIYNATELKGILIPDAGASKRLNGDGTFSNNNDVLDTNWKAQIMAGNYVPEMAESTYSVPAISSVSRPNNYDTDNDGMPNVWEIANGLDVNNPNDRNILQQDGYTNLEYFLNGLLLNSETITANAGQDVSICQGATITLTATGGSTYLWSTGATTASITVNPNTTTTYTVTAYSISGNNSDTDEVVVTVNTPPTANAGTDVATCLGTAVTLTASGGSTYLWNTGATTQSITVNPNSTTTYSVEVTQNGCTSTDQVIVTVNPLPNINAGNNVTIFSGESVTLSASGGSSYVWNTGATTQNITVSPTVTTTYTVTGSANGCQNIDTVTVIVQTDDVTANAGQDVSICQGATITLTATGGSTYLWSTGATTASITVNPNTTTTYTVTAYSITGNNSDTDEVVVTVNTPPTANAGTDVATCLGTAVTLTASGGSTYLWNTGATTQSITVNPNSTTTYSVEVTQNGCTSTDQVIVTVNPLPNINAGNNVTIFSGESVTLSASGGSSYVWNTGATTQNITVSPTVTTTYTVTGSANGCQNIDTVTVIVQTDDVTANAGQDVSICQGATITLTATGGSTYLWSTGATTASITVNPNATTTYTVTAYSISGNNSDTDEVVVTVNTPPTANAGTDVATCLGTAVTLTASGGSTYLWNTGATTQSITVNPNSTTTYSVEVTQNGCTSTDQVIVTVNSLPNINAGNNVTIFSGESVTLSASGGSSYVWNTGATTQNITVSPTVTTTYTVTGSANGCQNTDTVTVIVENETVTAYAGENETICQGYSTTLTASGGDTYLWNTGATTQSITVTPNATSTYTVTVFAGNAQDSDDVTVFVNPNPNVIITNGDEVTILEGEFITLSATGANSYLWNNGATQPNIAVSPPNSTTYSVVGFINNCENEKEVQVNVLERVNAEIQGEQSMCLNESIVLTAVGNTNAEYLWSTGEITQSITVSPTEDTEYSVTVYNALDYDTDEMMVTVTDCVVIVPEEPVAFEFLVYPNPTSGELNIKINGLMNVASIYIYDVSGKSIYYEKINEDEQQSFIKQLNVSNYASGVYFLKLVNNTSVITKKIIVN